MSSKGANAGRLLILMKFALTIEIHGNKNRSHGHIQMEPDLEFQISSAYQICFDDGFVVFALVILSFVVFAFVILSFDDGFVVFAFVILSFPHMHECQFFLLLYHYNFFF